MQSQFACFPEDSPVSLNKRSVSANHHDKCPGSVARPYLKSMGVDFDVLKEVISNREKKILFEDSGI
jgi:hypothetical protein